MTTGVARRLLVGLLVLAAWCASAATIDGPIRLIVPTTAGSLSDVLAREIGRGLSAQLQVPVVVDNKPGAGTIVGASQVAGAAPDGRTLLLAYVDHTYIPSLYPKAPFNARNDFTGIAMIGSVPLAMLVKASLPIRNASELIAYAKANPGKITFASAGPGSTLHLTGELFKSDYGVDLLHVPYRGGAAAKTALLAGEVDVYFGSPMTLMETRSTSKVRGIGFATPRRLGQFPDDITIGESTGKPFTSSIWYGILAPKKTPPDLVALLNKTIATTLAEPEFRKKMEAQSFEVTPMTPDAFNAFLESEFVRWDKLIADRQIRAE